MKISGIFLGGAITSTGILIKNFDQYMAESIIGTLIIATMSLGFWFFAFPEESEEWMNG